MMTKSTNLRSKAKNELANWLNEQKWDLWTTLSTSYELTLPSARRSMIRFHQKVSQTNNCKVFWASEKFDVKDGFHLHTLWKFENAIHDRETYGQFVKDWRTICKTNSANVYSEKFKRDWGACKYLSKYITKQITDYDFFDSNSMNKETINSNLQKFNEIGRNISARKKIERLCKECGVNYQDVKKEFFEEQKENKIWYEDTTKVEKQIYYSDLKKIIYAK
jgi:hypothetical protein